VVSVGTMPIKLQMVTTRGIFQDKVIKAMHRELMQKLGRPAFQQSVRRNTKKLLEISLKSQPEYLSMILQDGKLRAELGVADSQSAMESLVRAWVSSVQVRAHTPRIVGSRIVGPVISVRAIQADYEDVLGKAYASYISVNRQGQETHVPWLEWLLTRGTDIMVQTHSIYHPSTPTARSRTHTNTLMKRTKGQGWGVPEEFSGTYDDNFATRAVQMAMPDISDMVQHETQRRFG
jgi:hypothetical protein